MPQGSSVAPSLDLSLLGPGLRLAVGVSGGADSVALLHALAAKSREAGLVLSVAHLHHGLRGVEADGDLEFVRTLAAELDLPFHEARVDTIAAAKADPKAQKAAESIEEAARRLRYGWFRQLMAGGLADAVATAHTLDDQAETVLGKFLRGAWTEGLSGIHRVISFPEGRVLRPLLSATRAEVEAYLKQIGQCWREDSSNVDAAYTRNRIRHELLPELTGWNPRLREHLAQMAELAGDEEKFWQTEMARLAAQMILPGTPVRGGGRAGVDCLAIEITRLAELVPAVQRRLVRHAARQLGAPVDFPAIEALRALALTGVAGQKREVEGLRAERSHRELRLSRALPEADSAEQLPEYTLTIPGEVAATAFGLMIRTETTDSTSPVSATLRNWRPGDRVSLRYSGGPRKVKEVLERLKVTGEQRKVWPVLEASGRILWMRGVELEPEPGIRVTATELETGKFPA